MSWPSDLCEESLKSGKQGLFVTKVFTKMENFRIFQAQASKDALNFCSSSYCFVENVFEMMHLGFLHTVLTPINPLIGLLKNNNWLTALWIY